MTTKQKREVIAILEKDCEIRLRYCDFQGRTCAIGALGRAAGVGAAKLISIGQDMVGYDRAKSLANKISKRFGIDIECLIDIQRRNDNFENQYDRREAVMDIVRDIPTTD